MINRYERPGVVWVDCESPTLDEIRTVVEQLDVDPVVATELASPSARAKAERVGDRIYLILHFPTLKRELVANEIDFVVGKESLVTARYQDNEALLEFKKAFEVAAVLNRGAEESHGGQVFYHMMRDLYHTLADELDVLGSILQDIETNVFKGKEREMVIEISHVNRRILHYVASLRHHKPVLESYSIFAVAMFGESYRHYADVLIGECAKITSTLAYLQEYLAEIRATNDSLLTTKQNELTRLLTVLAFNTIPLTLIASIFGMNSEHMPIIGHTWDFWFIVGIMVITAVAMFLFFKRKRWL